MSFGAAAASARRRLPAGAPCPCGGGAFTACCGPVLAGEPAPTAERLMRSRYTAFALGDERHLRATWHPATTPVRLDLDPQLRWQRLEIIRAVAGGPADAHGTVEFRAAWRTSRGASGVLHEVSRFRRRGRRWLYLDGAVDAETASAEIADA